MEVSGQLHDPGRFIPQERTDYRRLVCPRAGLDFLGIRRKTLATVEL